MSTVSKEAAKVVRISTPIVLRGVRYGTYLALRNAPANNHLRMTYHDGTLEIMSPEVIHERPSHRFAVIFSVLCEELEIEFEGLGSTTYGKGEPRRKKGKAKEPDECFYFANAPRILDKEKIDLEAGDPPPDLWIEVDNRSSSKGKLPLYAALGVPEVWRYRARKKRLWFGRLSDDGLSYESIDGSLSLPMLTPSLVLHALSLGVGHLEMSWTKRLRAWVRETFLPGDGKGPLP